MPTRTISCQILVLLLLFSGCDRTHLAELERTRMELEKSRTELVQMQAQLAEIRQLAATAGYLDELEKLDSLKTKGVLTQEEFDRRKAAILERQPISTAGKPASTPVTGMDELAKQLRTLGQLYNKATINVQERDVKKTQLIARPLQTTDLKKDLETVQALYNESAITVQERDTLKQKILAIDAEPR